jgi:HEAT repeat protein
VETLGKLSAEALASHAAAVVAKLEDSSQFVRLAAVGTLGKLSAEALAPHAAAVLAKLEDSDDVRRAAVETLGKLELAVLAKYKTALQKLAKQDRDAAVRVSAHGALHKIEPTAGHIETILPSLEDSKWQVWVDAVRALGILEPVELAKHAAVLVARLEDSVWNVRLAAVETLAKLELAELAKYAEVLQKRANEDVQEDVREAATKAFAQLQASERPRAGTS